MRSNGLAETPQTTPLRLTQVVLYVTVSYVTVLYTTVLYVTVLYATVSYATVMYVLDGSRRPTPPRCASHRSCEYLRIPVFLVIYDSG